MKTVDAYSWTKKCTMPQRLNNIKRIFGKRGSQNYSVFLCKDMHPKTFGIIGFCLSLSLCAFSQKKAEFTPACQEAYHQMLSLKIDPALKTLQKEKLNDPDNVIPYFLENYADFFLLFFNESAADLKTRKANKELRIKLLQELPSSHPFRDLGQAIIRLHWATVNLKFNNRWEAGWDLKAAYSLARENEKRFPAYDLNGMIIGPMQLAASSVPSSLRWLANLVGIKGSMAEGNTNFLRFMNSNDEWAKIFRDEGIFYQCYILQYMLNQPDKALQEIETHELDIVNNHLFAYMAANLNLVNKKSWVSQKIISQRNRSSEYLNTTAWDFEMGSAKLYRLDPDAIAYFQRFLNNFKGNYYRKDAWLKLGYAYLMSGNFNQYKACMQKVIGEGSANTDADRRALKEARLGLMPNLTLLGARLLSDGGYANDALKTLSTKKTTDFRTPGERLEFLYRLGRIYDDLGQYDRALNSYTATINAGKTSTEYFAARAALQAGLIHENRGNCSQAMRFYQLCIDMKNHDYEESLEHRAKAGINRCSKN